MKAFAVVLAVVVACCSSASGFEVLTFWQEVRDAPGVEADPYSGNSSCMLLDEEWMVILDDPADVSSGRFWIKRRYVCATGST